MRGNLGYRVGRGQDRGCWGRAEKSVSVHDRWSGFLAVTVSFRHSHWALHFLGEGTLAAFGSACA